MLKISLIRHGQTEGNSKGKFIGKTDESLLEEERAALSNLDYPKVEAVYTSPLKRAVQTAEILFPYEKPQIVQDLAERDFGLFEGKTYRELTEDPKYRVWIENADIISYPEGEDISAFRDRCISALEYIINDAVSKKKNEIAIVTHGGTIMSIMHEYGFPKQKYLEWIVNNGEGYVIRLVPEDFMSGTDVSKRKIIVDGKIVRP